MEETGIREFLAFVLASETYALPLSCVREIMRVPSVTGVPRAPADVLGIVSVRGQVTTLVDLRRRLHVEATSIGSRTRILLVDQGDEILGLLCDRVLQVHRLSENEVEMASVLGTDASSYVMGIGRPGQRKSSTPSKDAKVKSAAGNEDILILLDPIALLKRQAHGWSADKGVNTLGGPREVGGISYALNILSVREIIRPLPMQSLPHAADTVIGVFDHRGDVVPIVDLRVRFSHESSAPTWRMRVG